MQSQLHLTRLVRRSSRWLLDRSFDLTIFRTYRQLQNEGEELFYKNLLLDLTNTDRYSRGRNVVDFLQHMTVRQS